MSPLLGVVIDLTLRAEENRLVLISYETLGNSKSIHFQFLTNLNNKQARDVELDFGLFYL